MFKPALVSAALLVAAVAASDPANAADQDTSWTAELSAINDVTGKSYEYAVSGYRIRMDFIAPDRIRWTRVEAPDGTAGTSGEEEIVHTDLRPGVFVIAFTEADGNVVDVFDIQRNRLFVNYITNDGTRFHSEAVIEDVSQ
ncbi:MoaF N-terminal domain-containing protein [Leisingera sp. F5]|uniref:MoaF-related domain-containing protein n=1 Tax=Leisingera sp. F5 TaxID=1813816 RepID=UPI000AAD3C4A|nr:MoaF N-terminal domain-containing protein [Leisingera sp. F5]